MLYNIMSYATNKGIYIVISVARDTTVAIHRLGQGNNNQMVLTSSQAMDSINLLYESKPDIILTFSRPKYNLLE